MCYLRNSVFLAASLAVPSVVLAVSPATTFEKDIRPILKAHCFQCHGESGVQEGGLDVRLKRWIVAGGDSGIVMHPGQPESSLLLQRIASGEMPPGESKLSVADVALIREWILQGAATARPEPDSLDNGDYITEEERQHWAFQPIRRPPIPRIELPPAEHLSIDNPVDAFVLARLQNAGLQFSACADRATLLRRATFDLWGLPPSPEMVVAFNNDDRPDAYEQLIDRLLASPHYGERWGRHWLDVAGYADSDGYTNEDAEREFAYFYRDYVIDSFNQNKPFDRFVCEQLAGDELAATEEGSGAHPATEMPATEMPATELPATALTAERIECLTATGFLRMAPDGTAAGGVDRALAANATIADTLEIVSTSLLGLTVGCARCHDHRYDPISQADYYRLRAIFEPAFDWKQWQLPKQRRVSLYTPADRQQRDVVEGRAKAAEAARSQRQQEHLDRTLYEELLVVPDDRRGPLELAFKTSKNQRTAEQIAWLEEFPSIGNISAGSLYLYAEQRARRANDIEKAADLRQATYVAEAQQTLLTSLPANERDEIQQALVVPETSRTVQQQELLAKYSTSVATLESLQQLRPEAFAEIKRYREAAQRCRELDAKTELAKLQEQINEIRSEAPPEKFLHILTEPENHTPPTHLFIRGDHQQAGPLMPPAELTVLQSFNPLKISENDTKLATSGRRLAYARHLTNGQHPLLARVIVNRLWQHHFGGGIVDTPGDFGSLGSRPTHPELLDWLAGELMRSNWDLKRIHRLLMLSQTFQQVSIRTEALDRVDPDNRLYARMSVRRLEAEAIRDAMLSVSGVLLSHMHGPPVPVKEDSVGQIVLGKEMLDGERKPSGEDQAFEGVARRSLYVQVRRSRPLAVLETFDLATVSPNCTLRSFSNVAPQSLLLMNSQFAIDQANHLASLVINSESELPQQLSLAWIRCFGRSVTNSELNELVQFVDRQATEFVLRDATITRETARQRALASVCQAMLSSNPFLYVD